MDIKTMKYVYLITLLLILIYFIIQQTGCVMSTGCFGRFLGIALGTLAGSLVGAYPYLILRRLLLKMNFPNKVELFGFIIYTMIIISAVRSVPR